jgi:PAS domain S-box-containing protein
LYDGTLSEILEEKYLIAIREIRESKKMTGSSTQVLTMHPQPDSTRTPRFDPFGVPLSVLITLWTLLIAGFAGLDCYQMYKAEYANAVAVAIDNYNKDVIYRRWGAMHGGVYAPVTSETPPNPNLAHVPDRDITLPSGKVLTLINPAYMTRQVHELSATQYGVRGHITSLKPLRDQNAPDDWERSALQLFETGAKEHVSLETLDGKPFLRLIRPLTTENGCLNCHAHQGYKKGDVRGGLSVSVPWTPHRERLLAQIPWIITGHGGIWLLGTVGIVTARRRLRSYIQERERILEEGQQRQRVLIESETSLQQQEQFIHSTLDGLSAHICVINDQGRIEITNRPWDTFAAENNAAEGACGTGASYLEACRSACEEDKADIDEFAAAVAAVIDGTLTEFVKEYPCHSPTTQRWFTCRINPFTVSGKHYAVVSHENITVRKQAENELRKLTRAVEQSPVTIVITDTSGTIEYVNSHFTRLTGYSAAEAIGQNPRVLKSGLMPTVVFEKLWSTILSGETWEGDLLNKSKDGTLFWEHAVISVLRDDNDAITNFLAVKEDVTGKKQIMEQLVVAKEKAEAATQAKSSFLATMSHEIRTPMNGVIGMTGLLLDTQLTAEQREFAEIVRKSGDNLLNLINDILDFSKIEAGKMDLEILEFDLRPTLEDTAELLALRAADKDLELICRIDPAVPSYLKGDPGRLRQIITNLVGNAIKFTHKGEVVISAKLTAEQDSAVMILFEVHDTGIGIPPDRCEAVFTPFTQVDGSTTRKYGGTGLGLAICKQLVELMGGEIGVTSQDGYGSTFWFTSRFEKQNTQTSEVLKTSEALKHADISGARILVVDDNATNRKLMATLLEHWGCRHEVAVDGESGLACLSEAVAQGDPFKLALLDQEMPGMDGLELARHVKADPLLQSTSLIMVTSLGQRGDAAALERIGFVGYLAKPLRQSQLHDCIALVLGRSYQTEVSKTSEVYSPLPKGIITRYTVAEYAEQGARILLAEDNIINQKVAQNMLNKLGYKADVVANGLEAVRALEMIDYDLVFMDCLMPEMDGFTATAAIRDATSHVKNHNVPIIAMTANAMQGDREKCLEASMDDYLAKPVKKEELAAVIEKWLQKDNRV